MTRRTVDITVDAYDAPMLTALAKLREAHRARGLADDEPHAFGFVFRVGDADVHPVMTAEYLKHWRSSQERDRASHGIPVDAHVIIAGEFVELIEATDDEARLYELLDVMGACARQWSRLQRAKGGE